LREDQHSLKGEVEDRGSAIVTLQTELEKIRGEVLERDDAIANLKTELAAGEVKQLNLFPGQEPTPTPEPVTEPETIPTPNPTPEPKAKAKTKTKSQSGTVELLTVGTPGLVEYINSIKPGSGIIAKTINNAITRHLEGKGEGGEGGKGKNLSSLESDYKFKYLGKFGNSHKFSIPNL
jgi:hypothetical protein